MRKGTAVPNTVGTGSKVPKMYTGYRYLEQLGF